MQNSLGLFEIMWNSNNKKKTLVTAGLELGTFSLKVNWATSKLYWIGKGTRELGRTPKYVKFLDFNDFSVKIDMINLQ